MSREHSGMGKGALLGRDEKTHAVHEPVKVDDIRHHVPPRRTKVFAPKQGLVAVLVVVLGATVIVRVDFAFWVVLEGGRERERREKRERGGGAKSIATLLKRPPQPTKALVRHRRSEEKVRVLLVDLHVEEDPTVVKDGLPRVPGVVARPVKVPSALEDDVGLRALLLDDNCRNVSVSSGSYDSARVCLALVTVRFVDSELLGSLDEGVAHGAVGLRGVVGK